MSRAHDIGIGTFPLKHGLFYDASRHPTEQEASMVMPSGFSEMALRPLFLELSERLADSDWSLSDWREYSYQVVITLSYQTAATNIRVRLHYDKNLPLPTWFFLTAAIVSRKPSASF